MYEKYVREICKRVVLVFTGVRDEKKVMHPNWLVGGGGGGIGFINVDDGEGCVCDDVVLWFGWTTLDSFSSYGGGGGGSCYGVVGEWRLFCGSCECCGVWF